MTLKQTITPLKDITINDIFTMADAPANIDAELVCNPLEPEPMEAEAELLR